jgi:arginine N-succinyltransferase
MSTFAMDAQVIAQVHPQTLPAYRVLESEGLCYQGYVDIFDAGPTLEANSDELRAVKESHTCASKLSIVTEGKGRYLLRMIIIKTIAQC